VQHFAALWVSSRATSLCRPSRPPPSPPRPSIIHYTPIKNRTPPPRDGADTALCVWPWCLTSRTLVLKYLKPTSVIHRQEEQRKCTCSLGLNGRVRAGNIYFEGTFSSAGVSVPMPAGKYQISPMAWGEPGPQCPLKCRCCFCNAKKWAMCVSFGMQSSVLARNVRLYQDRPCYRQGGLA
jgi:hypothetical protein